jgi:hypothetical protein
MISSTTCPVEREHRQATTAGISKSFFIEIKAANSRRRLACELVWPVGYFTPESALMWEN